MEKVHDTIRFAKNVIKKVNRDQVRAHSAEAAFFLMMCFFPLLMLLITMLKYTSIMPAEIINMAEEIIPFEVRELLEPVLDSIYNQTVALVSGTVIAAVWTVGKGVLGMADGLNTIYRIEETRNYFVTRFRAAVYMVALVIAIGVSAVIMVMGYGFSGFISEKITLLSFLPDFSTIIPALIAMVVLTVLFVFMYSYLPNHRMKMSGQLPGAIFASVAWSIFSFIFSLYLDYSANMSVLYGSLTTLVAIMLWLYACMYLWFIGAEINHYLAAPELFSPDAPAPWERSAANDGNGQDGCSAVKKRKM